MSLKANGGYARRRFFPTTLLNEDEISHVLHRWQISRRRQTLQAPIPLPLKGKGTASETSLLGFGAGLV